MDLYQSVPEFYAKGWYRSAYGLVLNALDQDWKNPHFLIWASELARVQQFYQDQIIFNEIFLKLNGPDPYWLAELGKAFLETGKWEEAYACFQSCMNEIPTHTHLLIWDAWSCFNLERYKETIEKCTKGLELEPLCDELRWIRAMANYNLFRMIEAAKDFVIVKVRMKNYARYFGHKPLFPMALWN